MAIRTTSLLVRGVLTSDYGPDSKGNDPDLTPFIRIANLIVDRVVACAVEEEEPLLDAEATEMETWLAAHFYKMSDQQRAGGGTAGASFSFRAAGGLNLDGSTYGQTAKLLDKAGCLVAIEDAATEGPKVAGAFWGGRRPSEQTDYVDRS